MDDKRFAILIDADNVSAKYIKYILDEISNYGIATYKRIYADWTRSTSSSWKDVLLENSITPMQQYNYTVGKNSSDSALIIDAMDILYSNNVDGFCIVSSDSDFTRLATRLRESGMIVIGMGEEKTPKPFVAACNQFKYLDILAKSENSASINNIGLSEEAAVSIEAGNKNEINKNLHEVKENSKGMTSINTIKNTIIKMINDISINDSGVYMGELGSKLTNRYPDFDVRNYGYSKLSKFLGDIDDLTVEAQKVYLKSDKVKSPAPLHHKKIKIDDTLKQDIIDIIKSYDDKTGVDIGYVNQRLLTNHPGYTLKYGFSKIPKFFRALDFIEVTHNENNSTILSLKDMPKVIDITSTDNYDDEVILTIKEILTKAGHNGVHVGSLGEKLLKMYPDFKPKNYGFKKLTTFLNALKFVTLKSKSRTIVYAYLKKLA